MTQAEQGKSAMKRDANDRNPHQRQTGSPSTSQEAGRRTSEVLLRGLLAGAVGVAAMTLAEKLEQAVTKRPNSYVPPTRSNGSWACPPSPTRSAFP